MACGSTDWPSERPVPAWEEKWPPLAGPLGAFSLVQCDLRLVIVKSLEKVTVWINSSCPSLSIHINSEVIQQSVLCVCERVV